MPTLSLLPGERVIARWFASHTRGQITIGGRLWLTDRRVAFVPNPMERLMHFGTWSCRLDSVTAVGIADREPHPFNGALRRSLAITHDDTTEYFVVNEVGDKVERIETARAEA